LAKKAQRLREDVGVQHGLDGEQRQPGGEQLGRLGRDRRIGTVGAQSGQCGGGPQPVEHRGGAAALGRGHQVHVHDQVGLDHPPVHRDRQLADRSYLGELLGVLGIVVAQQSVGVERAEHALTDQGAQLGGRLPTVQPDGGDQGDIVDSCRRSPGQHGLDDRRPQIRRRHAGDRHGVVVEGDGQAHARPKSRAQRIGPGGVVEGGGDGIAGVHGRQRVGRVDDSGADREPLQPEGVAGGDQDRWGPVVDVEDESGADHLACSCR
jgi:hypothetical protein